MGANQPAQAIYNGNFSNTNWKVIDRRPLYSQNQPILVKLPQSTVQAEQYIIKLEYHDSFRNHIDIYKKRASSSSNNLVNILSAQLLRKKQINVQQCDIVRVRTQRIPWRLTSSQNLTIQQGLYIIKGASRGFNQLSQHYPEPFSVFPDMIGTNIYGTIRVWLNPNFAVNSLISDYQKISSFEAMKKSIIKVVEERLFNKELPMRNQLLNAPHLFGLSAIAAKYLNRSNQQSKRIAKEIMEKSKITTMLVQHFKSKSKQKNSKDDYNRNSIFNKSKPKSCHQSLKRSDWQQSNGKNNQLHNQIIYGQKNLTPKRSEQLFKSYYSNNLQHQKNFSNITLSIATPKSIQMLGETKKTYSRTPKQKIQKSSFDNSDIDMDQKMTIITDSKRVYDNKKYRPSSSYSTSRNSHQQVNLVNPLYNSMVDKFPSKPPLIRRLSSFNESASPIQQQLGIRQKNVAVFGKRNLYSSQISAFKAQNEKFYKNKY